ncbi:two-component regulator propeller domain-containing protein [Pollutibacter soli]|uniref:two-component regulator propeller domain-containing protein n=1 Tax=Pollutibacter soli TaxID=3034157 RepID=UPI00301419A3
MFTRLLKKVVGLFFIFPCSQLPAQRAPVFDLISLQQGLPSVFVFAVMQDRHGFIWLGTGNGLVKYDGYQFKTFKSVPDDTTSISKNQVIALYEDSRGYIWVGTSEWACRFDPGTEKFLRLHNSPHNPYAFKYVQNIAEDKDGFIWVGGAFKGELRKVDPETGQFLAKNYSAELGLKTDKSTSFYTGIRALYSDKEKNVWVATDNGLFLSEPTVKKNSRDTERNFKQFVHIDGDSNSIASGRVHTIYTSNDEDFWILTGDQGLDHLNKKTGKFTHYGHPPSKRIVTNTVMSKQCFAEDESGNLWIVTLDGIHIFNKNQKAFLNEASLQKMFTGFPEAIAFSVINDRAGSIWVGSSAGLIQADLQKNNFGKKRFSSGFTEKDIGLGVIGLEEDNQGRIWIGTMKGGLHIWDKKADKIIHFAADPTNPKSLRSDIVSAIHKDRKGRMWVANGETISRYDEAGKKFIHTELDHDFLDNSAISSIFTIAEDHNGLLWLGTSNGHIVFNPENSTYVSYPFDPITREKTVSDWWVLNILEDHNGTIWMGLGSQAWSRFDPVSKTMSHFEYDQTNNNTISSNTGTAILEDSKQNLWLGTLDGGLVKYDFKADSFSRFTTKQGLPGNSIYSIIEDDKGYLWLSTDNGICRFSYPDLHVMNFNANDGLQSNMFSGNYSESVGMKGSDGMIYFGGGYGLNAFFPDQIKANPYLPPVVLTEFSIANRPVPGITGEEEIVLKPNENFFSIRFAALNYTNPSGNRYAYQLAGFDNRWIESGTGREAVYTKVPPGTYTFRVKASNNSGLWNEKGLEFPITVLPPWWKTNTAYIFYGLAAIALIAFLFQMQRQRIVRKQEEKSRKLELEHAREIEKAYDELKSTQAQLIQSEKMASLGVLTAGIAHEIQNPLNFVNNFSEVSVELIDEMQDAIKKNEIDEATGIASDIKINLEKISQHGRRADTIVKSMMEHSRSSTGAKEPTDINALTDEYFRIAYHGWKARKNDITIKIATSFDSAAGMINMVAGDIGRVLLNLFNNAFYAVEERTKKNESGYVPEVSVGTEKIGGTLLVSVKDNGTGIAESQLEKIFQPFFTTKPTGEGTGLGLSLSYDIVKAHNGELKVSSVPGKGAEFVLKLYY